MGDKKISSGGTRGTPILNGPYDEPAFHYATTAEGNLDYEDIHYWMVDDDYDGANFVARQVFFCGGDADEFDKFKRGLSGLALASSKAKAERTLKLEIDDEAFERVYGFRSHPIPAAKGRRVAVRVISQFGEESTKVMTL